MKTAGRHLNLNIIFRGTDDGFFLWEHAGTVKKELLGEESEISSHLIELITGIRSDELENSYRKKVRNTKNASEKKRKVRQS